MELNLAKHWASRLRSLLAPYCERIEIAGPIRREKAECGDIELVAVPRMVEIKSGLFDDETEVVSDLDRALEVMVQATGSKLVTDNLRPKCWGPRSKRLRFHGVPVDLFIVLPPAQWGLIYLLRTGSADFSRLVVTTQDRGGLLPVWLRVEDGHIVRGTEVIETPEEADVFRVLELDWLEPQARTGEVRK